MERTPHPYDFSVMEEGYAFIFNTQEMPQEDGSDIERTIYAGALFFKSNPNAEQVKANFHSLLQLYAK